MKSRLYHGMSGSMKGNCVTRMRGLRRGGGTVMCWVSVGLGRHRGKEEEDEL